MEHTPLKLDGRKAQEVLTEKLRARIKNLPIYPKLVIFQIGDSQSSSVYVQRKVSFGKSIGVFVEVISVEVNITQEELMSLVEKYNELQDVQGIILQLPVPLHIDEKAVIRAISPEKDVDGLHPFNMGILASGDSSGLISATAKGILELLLFYKIEISGKRIAVVGRSNLVGRPLALLLLAHNATVTIAHSKTKNLESITSENEIVITAVGKPGLITKNHLRNGAVVVDVGTTTISNAGKNILVGDVVFDEVLGKVSAISPVPGGVGPMTVLSLFSNLIHACEKSCKNI